MSFWTFLQQNWSEMLTLVRELLARPIAISG